MGALETGFVSPTPNSVDEEPEELHEEEEMGVKPQV